MRGTTNSIKNESEEEIVGFAKTIWTEMQNIMTDLNSRGISTAFVMSPGFKNATPGHKLLLSVLGKMADRRMPMTIAGCDPPVDDNHRIEGCVQIGFRTTFIIAIKSIASRPTHDWFNLPPRVKE